MAAHEMGETASLLPFAPIGQSEVSSALDTLVLAFISDPVERWLYPEPHRYLMQFPRFLSAFAGRAFAEQTAWKLGECAAVALWLPPGTGPDGDAIVNVLAETVPPDKHADTFATLEQMDDAHPAYPHWYLPWFGVDGALQGRGLGGRLMEHCLKLVDASHSPAYLETPNPRTIAFYERHGFEVVGVAQAGACPPVTLMHRASRA